MLYTYGEGDIAPRSYNEGVNNNSVLDGVSLETAVRAFSPEVVQILSDTNRALNGFIGLTISLGLILLFAHLIRWAIVGSHSKTGRASIATAVRAFIAIFFMIDVWAIMRLIQRITELSPAIAYVILIFGAVLLFAWSILGLGDLLIESIVGAVRIFTAYTIRMIRHVSHPSTIISYIQSKNDAVLRFFILLTMAVGVSVISIIWSLTGHAETSRPVVFRDSAPISESMGAMALTREDGGVEINGTTYTNKHYGISITYPDGWILEESTSSNTLILAYSKDKEFFSGLNAGVFEDVLDGSHDAYLTGVWRIQKFIFGAFAEDSEGVLQTQTVDFPDIGYSSSTRITMKSYWRFDTGQIHLVRDTYLAFRNNPVFYTLQVRAWGETTDDEYAQAVYDISDSIKLLPLGQ